MTSALSASWKIKLLYDGECPFCKREITWMQRHNSAGKLAFEDIAAPGFDAARYGLTQSEVMRIIHGVLPDGRIIKKVEVFQEAYTLLGFGWLVAPTRWPVFKQLCSLVYTLFARYRVPLGNFFGRQKCAQNRCGIS